MSKGTPVPYSVIKAREKNLVTTIIGDEIFDENDKIGTGKLTPKPDDAHRARLKKRAMDHIALVNKVVPDSMLKTPSQRKSERLKHKLDCRKSNENIQTSEPSKIPGDCRGCVDEGHCAAVSIHTCCRPSMVLHCKQCGQKVRFRIIPDAPWELCPVCTAARR